MIKQLYIEEFVLHVTDVIRHIGQDLYQVKASCVSCGQHDVTFTTSQPPDINTPIAVEVKVPVKQVTAHD